MTRDLGGGYFSTSGNEAVVAAYNAKSLCEPLLRALLAANIERHGPDHAAALSARVQLGEVLGAAACISFNPPNGARLLAWGAVPTSDADAVLALALASVRRSGLLLTSEIAVRVVAAYAGSLSQQGLFARGAVLLRELLEAFVHRDGGYTVANWGSDGGLGPQIQVLASHTQNAVPEGCMAGVSLLRVHLAALRSHNAANPHSDLRSLYYQRGAQLLLSHCCNAGSEALLAEAEVLARELVTQRVHAWDLTPYSKLFQVIEAQVVLGREGATFALEECRETICMEVVATLNSTDVYGGDHLLGTQMRELVSRIGYFTDGSGKSQEQLGADRMCGIKLHFLRQHGMIERIESMQRERLDNACRTKDATTLRIPASVPRVALLAHGRLLGLLVTQGKWDETSSGLCELSALVSASVDATDKLAEDVDMILALLRNKFRSVDGNEPILLLGCEETVFRHRVAACQQQYASDPQAARIQLLLIKASQDLTILLLSTAADVGEAESTARLCATTAKASLDALRASDVEQGKEHIHREKVDNGLLQYSSSLWQLTKVFRCDADPNGNRAQERVATLNELIVTLTARIDLPNNESLSLHMGRIEESTVASCQGQRFEAEFDLVVLRQDQGDSAGARLLAKRLVDDSSTLPLVRARAMCLLAMSGLEEADAAKAEGEEPAPPLLDRLAEAEPLLSRACVLFSGMLHDQISCRCYRGDALEWSELEAAFDAHARILHDLGRDAEAANVVSRCHEVFGALDDDAVGEAGADGEE